MTTPVVLLPTHYSVFHKRTLILPLTEKTLSTRRQIKEVILTWEQVQQRELPVVSQCSSISASALLFAKKRRKIKKTQEGAREPQVFIWKLDEFLLTSSHGCFFVPNLKLQQSKLPLITFLSGYSFLALHNFIVRTLFPFIRLFFCLMSFRRVFLWMKYTWYDLTTVSLSMCCFRITIQCVVLGEKYLFW